MNTRTFPQIKPIMGPIIGESNSTQPRYMDAHRDNTSTRAGGNSVRELPLDMPHEYHKAHGFNLNANLIHSPIPNIQNQRDLLDYT